MCIFASVCPLCATCAKSVIDYYCTSIPMSELAAGLDERTRSELKAHLTSYLVRGREDAVVLDAGKFRLQLQGVDEAANLLYHL